MTAAVEGKRVSKKAVKAIARQESIEWLREVLKPGDTVYCVLRHVSRSGMMRHIDFYNLVGGEPQWLSWHIARALDMRTAAPLDSIKVSGCGMDMGFHVVYNLAYTLWKDGVGCIGEGCPSNDHSNGDRDYTPHGSGQHRNTALSPNLNEPVLDPQKWGERIVNHWHSDGGYALRSRRL